MDGRGDGFKCGYAVSLSADGTVVAFGCPTSKDEGLNRGTIQVYEKKSSTVDWEQVGQDINGVDPSDQFGYSIAMNADGTIVAGGSPYHSTSPNERNDAGQARVFKLTSGVWNQLGGDIDGASEIDWFGYAMSMAGDGNILAVSSPYEVRYIMSSATCSF
jgi:hypothetical protein